MLTCAKIAANATLGSCRQGNAAVSGSVIAINWEDWMGASITETSGVISAITLASGAYAYRLTSKDKGIEASYTMNKGTYGNSLTHQLIIRSFDRTQANKDLMNKLMHGRYVFIVEHVDLESNDTVYEVYGRQCGLTASALESNSNDADGVLNTVTLASEDNARESALPTSIYVTSLTATKTMVDALVYSAS